MNNPIGNVTQILNAAERGDAEASAQLLPLVYQELRNLAAQKLAHEPPGHTLQATALVHEAYVRLLGPGGAPGDANPRPPILWDNRAHFFAAAAESMRRILIENVRRRAALCHGGGRRQVALDDALSAVASPAASGQDTDELIALDVALTRLESQHKTKAELVKLRYFVGLSLEDAADALGISRAT